MKRLTIERLELCYKIPIIVALSPVIILVTGIYAVVELIAGEISEANRWGNLVDDYAAGKRPRAEAEEAEARLK